MPKLFYDAIPPQYHNRTEKIWRENSEQMKRGVVLTTSLVFVAVALSVFVSVHSTQAATPTFVGCTATQAGSPAGITPALPSGVQTNDILLLFLETANQDISISAPNGGVWAPVTDSLYGTGVAGSTSATRLTAFWSRFNGTQGAPTTSDSGNHQLGTICAFRGVTTSGIPWDTTSGNADEISDTSLSAAGATTTAADTFVVIASALMDDSQNFGSTWTNADLANIVQRQNIATSAGNDGRLAIVTGEKASAGIYGTTDNITTANSVKSMMTIALKPAPLSDTVAVDALGLQTPSVSAGSIANYAGGVFRLVRAIGDPTNITAISISETDATFSADANIVNASFTYDIDATLPHDCASESFPGAFVFQSGGSFASEKITFTNTGVAIDATRAFCGYLTYDLSAVAPSGDTIEFQITATGDVVDSGISTISGLPAAMSGATTVAATPVGQIQYNSDHSTVLPTGGSIPAGSTAYLDAHVSSGVITETFTPKVEVRDTLTPFTGVSTAAGAPVIYDAERPEQRRSTDMVYDSANQQLVLFGGYGGDSSLANMNDVWVFSLAAGGRPQWKRLSPGGTAPSARRGLQMIYDSTDTPGDFVDNGRVIIYGGTNGSIDATGVYALTMTPGSEAWSKLTTSGTAPTFALQHNAVYDPVRDQMLVFGGRNASGNLGGVMYKLEMNGGTEAWAVAHNGTGTSPGAREAATMIYDTTNNYVWVHSGCVGATTSCTQVNDVWRLKDLDTTPVWENASPASCSPHTNGGLAGHAMGFDPVNGQAVVWGGAETGVGYTADIYTFNVTASGTVACSDHSPSADGMPFLRGFGSTKGVFDPNRNAMFFGFGYNGTSYVKDLTVFDSLAATGAWGIKEANGVTYMRKRDQMQVVYDPTGAVAYGFGGAGRNLPNLSSHLSETWRFQPANGAERWENAGADFAPFAREAGAFVWDSVDSAGAIQDGNRAVYCGGLNLTRRVTDCWQMTPPQTPGGRVAWTLLSPSGTGPSGRWGVAHIYDPANDRLLFWGGEGNSSNYFNEIWELTLGETVSWTKRIVSGGPAQGRRFAQAVFDANSSRMVVYGGSNGTAYSAEVWSLSTGVPGSEAWTQLTPAGCDATCDRDRHIAIYDPANDRMLSFGGYDGTTHYNDVWQLTLGNTPAWSRFSVSASGPSGRRSAKGFYDPINTRFVIFGGRIANEMYNETWEFDTTAGLENWKNIDPRLTVPVSVGASPVSGNYHWQMWVTGSSTGDSAAASYGGNTDAPPADSDFSVL